MLGWGPPQTFDILTLLLALQLVKSPAFAEVALEYEVAAGGVQQVAGERMPDFQ